MKSNSILHNTLMLATLVALFPQGSALAQTIVGTNGPPPAQEAEAHAGANTPASWTNVDFYFPGGPPKLFLRAVDKQYKVDWSSVADIPSEMEDVHIPALRLSRESMERILPNFGPGRMRAFGGGGGGGGGSFAGENQERTPLDALVALYNNLGQARPELGNLIVEGDPVKPSIVIVRSFGARAPSGLKIKAFALRGIPEGEWGKLGQELSEQFDLFSKLNHEGEKQPKTDIAIHPDTGLLIVVGPESYVEAAESLVAAWHANGKVIANQRPQPAPTPPGPPSAK
jgi:hypothetical protein